MYIHVFTPIHTHTHIHIHTYTYAHTLAQYKLHFVLIRVLNLLNYDWWQFTWDMCFPTSCPTFIQMARSVFAQAGDATRRSCRLARTPVYIYIYIYIYIYVLYISMCWYISLSLSLYIYIYVYKTPRLAVGWQEDAFEGRGRRPAGCSTSAGTESARGPQGHFGFRKRG